jgi:hypothetical protein
MRRSSDIVTFAKAMADAKKAIEEIVKSYKEL